MLPDRREGRPGENRAATISVGNRDESTIPTRADFLSDVDAWCDHVRGYLVVQVVIDDAGHRRTHVYRSAAAAERAVTRARERGRYAHVSLCQLLPVGVIAGLGTGVG
jgi:hypothetical protein